MDFGLFYQLPAWPGQDPAQRYRDTLDQIAAGDDLGFDVAWLAEMHFAPQFSIMPSPLVVGAAVAARTQRIRIGIGVTLLPLHDPIRVAEDTATLDIISGGRLEYGVGRGARRQHFEGFGIPVEERNDRFVEALEVLLRAWSDEPLTYDGRFFHYRDVDVIPKPLQRPRPRTRLAVNSDDSAERAARSGLQIMLTPITASHEMLLKRIDIYRRGRAEAGSPATPDDIAVLLPSFVAPDGDTARAGMEKSIMSYVRIVAEVMLGPYLHKGVQGQAPALAERLSTITYPEVLDLMCATGDPDEVTARIQEAVDAYGAGQVICWFNPGGLVEHDKVIDTMRLFMEQVRPRFA